MFEVLPAIDIRGGRVVRLAQGDFGRETVYDEDPAAVALGFARQGARWLHVVDLDAAREGRRRQADAVRRIVAAVGEAAPVEVGPGLRASAAIEVAGGLRDAGAVEDVLSEGAGRVVIGTAALHDSALAREMVVQHGAERVAAALDVRDGRAVGNGWRDGAPGRAVDDALARLADAGVTTFEVTAIDRDGLLGGPDLGLLERLVGLGLGNIVASGGISSIADLRRVREIGCAGAILGRALYEGRINLPVALALT